MSVLNGNGVQMADQEKKKNRYISGVDIGLGNVAFLSAVWCEEKRRRWHIHIGDELLLLFDGEMTYIFRDGTRTTLNGSHVLLIPGGVEHRSEISFVSSSSRLNILMNPHDSVVLAKGQERDVAFCSERSFAHPLQALPLTDHVYLLARRVYEAIQESGEILPSLEPLHEQDDGTSVHIDAFPSTRCALSPLKQVHLRSLVMAFLAELAVSCENPPSEDGSTRIVKRATEWMDRHLAERLDIMALARVAGCSRAYLFRAFRTCMGVSPNTVFMKKRVMKAESLLRKRRMSVVLIAESLGFSSAQYFATVFKKFTGKSPTHWGKGVDK